MVISTSIVQGIHTMSRLEIVIPLLIQELSVTEIFKAFLNVYTYRLTLGEQNVKEISWLQGYIVAVVSGSAGGTTISIVRGAPIDVLHQTDFWIIYGILYWMLFCNSQIFNGVHHVFIKYPRVKLLLVGLSGINKGYSLIRLGIDREKELIAKVVSGVLVSCGGALWFELCGLGGVNWKFSTPRQFFGPSPGVKVALYTTFCYLTLLIFMEDRDEAHAIGSVIYALLAVYNAHKSICDQNNRPKKKKIN